IDHRCTYDTDVAAEVPIGTACLADIGVPSRTASAVEVSLPERGAGDVRIKSVNSIVHCRYVKYIARGSSNRQPRRVKDPSIDLIVNLDLKQLPELTRIDIRRVQDRLRLIRSCPLVVIISSEDVDGL